jgi:hypothetical protein
MSHQEVLEEWKQGSKLKKDGQPYAPFTPGLEWRLVKPYSGGWEKLPE